MPDHRHDAVEREFHALLERHALPAPDEVARAERALIFLWYAPKACVVVDLDDAHGLDRIDLGALEDDLLGPPLLPWPLDGFAPAG